STVAVETTRSKSRKTALVGELCERVGLVHELGQLGTAEEVAHHSGKRLRVDQLLWGHALDVYIEQGHALLYQTLSAGKAHAALVRKKFTHCTDAAGTKVVDIVDHTVTFFQAKDVAHGCEEILWHHDALIGIHFDTKLLVDLVATHASEVVL